ncbi:unnamed protein product [Brassica rapa subsp. narinosa]
MSRRTKTCRKPQQRSTTRVRRRITPETRRRFTGPRRKLNGASPDHTERKRLPKLTTSSALHVITGEHETRNQDLIQKQSPHSND